MASFFSIFLLTSCGKVSPNAKSGDFEESTSLRDLGSPLVEQPCGPAQFGLTCTAFEIFETEATDVTGCEYEVTMKVSYCEKDGKDFVTFSLLELHPLNNEASPCKEWWEWLINLPPGDFQVTWDAMEDRVTGMVISKRMNDYILFHPEEYDCEDHSSVNAAFFKPLCTKVCERVIENRIYYNRLMCSADGCCVRLTSYCVDLGQVIESAPTTQLLSDCTNFINPVCKPGSYEFLPCNNRNCIE